MREFDLRIPVAKWLLSRGLAPICEVASLWNCDLVGVHFSAPPRPQLDYMVAVELKLDDIGDVLRQCRQHVEFVNETYAAMPPQTERRINRFREAGFGLLCVEGDSVSVVISSTTYQNRQLGRWHRAMRQRRREHEWRMLDPQMRRDHALKKLWISNQTDQSLLKGVTRCQ